MANAINMNDWTTIELGNSLWTVPSRYTNFTIIGQGTFGLVCSADDSVLGHRIAIKKLSLTRIEEIDEINIKRFYREIRLLRHVNHDNLISILDLFSQDSTPDNLRDLYFSTYYMETDLNNLLKTDRLSDGHIEFFTYQILRGLKYLHSANIIHRDLKPSNLVVDENCGLRIIDFGLARTENTAFMSGYVATRWYRAPEVMLTWMHYGKSVDIWSVGCIIVEMFLSRPLFPGNGYIDQLNRILQVVGFPSESFMQEIDEESRTYLEGLPLKPVRVNFNDYFHEIPSPNAIDLIDRMLQLDPRERITCEIALESSYLENYYDPDEEPVSEPFNDSHEYQNLSLLDYKRLIMDEIDQFQRASN